MRIKACLKPGQKGTKKWGELYGDRLVSVRYRYDLEKKRRYTTVEFIAEESDWQPGISASATNTSAIKKRDDNDRLGIRVAFYEMTIREQVKEAGGIWRPRQKLWELSYKKIVKLGLEERIIENEND